MTETTPPPPPPLPGSESDPVHPPLSDERVEAAIELIRKIREEISKAVVGQERVIDDVLTALLAGGHILLEGQPGLGKTLLVLALARSFQGEFARIQFTPDLMPSDVTGHALFDVETKQFRIRKGPAFTQLLLADEINRAPAKTQAALLEVMQEGQITIEGESFQLAPPFMTLATQNPIEQEGTFPLPEAQLDRFLLKVLIGYPGAAEEAQLVTAVTRGKLGKGLDVESVSSVATPADIVAAQEATAQIEVVPAIVEYAVNIVRETRVSRGIALGAGPRGPISLVRAGRARAVLQGRSFVIPDDIREVAPAALRHRIILSPELELEGRTADDALKSILDHVEAPRQ